MIRALAFACLCLLAPLRAEDAPQPLSPAAGAEELRDEDVYYAPIDDSADGATPSAQALPQGAYVSRARIHAFDIATGQAVDSAELFLGGVYIGRSPLVLKEHVVGKPLPPLAARLDGYSEGERPAVDIPADGAAVVALASERSAGWYTTPAWVLGLGLLGASAALYDANNSGPGLALAGGGLAVISLSQLTARFVHLPGLRKRAEAYNASTVAAPPLDAKP